MPVTASDPVGARVGVLGADEKVDDFEVPVPERGFAQGVDEDPRRPHRCRRPGPCRAGRCGAPPSPLPEQASALGLRLLGIPLALPPVATGMAWHPRHTADGAHH